jgi:hypothetical protein
VAKEEVPNASEVGGEKALDLGKGQAKEEDVTWWRVDVFCVLVLRNKSVRARVLVLS